MAISNPTPLLAAPHIEGNNGNFNSFTTSDVSPTAGAWLLIIAAGSNSNNPATPETLQVSTTLGDVGSFTKITDAERNADATTDTHIAAWWAQVGDNPTTGTVTVSTVSGGNLTGLIVAPLEVTSHDTGTPLVQAISGQNTAASATLTFANTPATDSLVIAAMNSRAETDGITPDADYTELIDGRIGSGSPWLHVQYKNGNADTTVSWTNAREFVRNVYFALEIASETVAPIEGEASITLDDATLTATGAVTIAGSATVTLEDATATATGTVAIAGTSSVTLANATVTATGTLAISGTLTATLANATSSASGTVAIVGEAALTLDDATVEATGVIGDAPLVGTLSATLDDATVEASGALTIAGTLSTTLADATGSATGTLRIGASATITLDNATLTATGSGQNNVAYVTYTMQVEMMTVTTAQVEMF